MTVKCLKYIYQFDKKGTITRLAVFLSFPIIANALAVANARLTDAMQEYFGTGLVGAIIPIFLVIIGLEILDEIFTYIRRIISAVWKARMSLFLETDRHAKRMDFSLPFIDSRDYNRLDERMRGSGGGMNAQLNILLSIPDFFRILVNIVFALWIVGQFSLVYVGITVLISLPHFYVSFKQIFATRKLTEEDLDFVRATYVYEKPFRNLIEFKDSKTSGALKNLLKIFKNRREQSLSLWQKLFRKYAGLNTIASIVSMLTIFVIQYFVIRHTIDGALLIGQATLIVLQVHRLKNNIDEFSWFLPEQYTYVIGCKYLFLYLNTTENVEQTSGAPVRTENDYIEFKDINFSYPVIRMESMRKLTKDIDTTSEQYFGLKPKPEEDEEKSMSDFKLTIPHLKIHRGERIAVVGKNGNGKTTFLQILMNLYPLKAGSIHIFGNNLQTMSHFDVHAHFSILFQDYSTNDLKTNEYIGLSEIEHPDMERIKLAAKMATADEFIEKWKDGYTTQLGIAFKGVKPSKGQWQKLALARTFYKEAPITILDEPTAAIDSIASKKIFENLASFDQNKILIFVCHNITDIPYAATRVLVFDEGKIIGDGTPAQLLKTCPTYKELYESERGK